MFKSAFAAMAVVALTLGACAGPTAKTSASAPAAASAEGARITAAGGFEGRSKHITTGAGSIARLNGQWVVILGKDFSFDGAPDPKVALGANGYRKDATLAKLASNTGQQVYAIPASLDVADFNEIWIWCNKFTVPLGVAKLTLT